MQGALPYDLLVVGGGINGAGIARDAAGRGLKVLLVEQADLASGTSSASTKLIHGGLRYLEYYEFRLVREALTEREVLLSLAPHIIRPLSFVLPYEKSLRPAWMIRAGLFLYDYLGGRKRLPASRRVDLSWPPFNDGLKGQYRIGFEYADCWVDDARLVVLNALGAQEKGAVIRTRTACRTATRIDGMWRVELVGETGSSEWVTAKALVNATGPWAASFVGRIAGAKPAANLRLVKGSHIVIPRLYQGEHAFILQNFDRRIVFAIPYEEDFTLVGTTDISFDGDPKDVAISADEIAYLIDIVNRHFQRQVTKADIVWTYSGVRPLFDEGDGAEASALSRDYVLEIQAEAGTAPLLNVFGGKITTYRRLAEQAIEKLRSHLPQMGQAWTAKIPLPGGDLPEGDFAKFKDEVKRRYPWLKEKTILRLARAYGTRLFDIVGTATGVEDLGRHFGADLYECELIYLKSREWARSADDVLWRRSKLGLRMRAEEKAAIEIAVSRRAEAQVRAAGG